MTSIGGEYGSELTMLVGTYTEGSSSEGIYVLRFDQISGKAGVVGSVKASNPSFLTVSPDEKQVYAVSEYNDGRQGVYAFRFDKTAGKLSPLNFQTTVDKIKGASLGKDARLDGSDPCYIYTNGRQVVTANYTGGDISIFPINKDGSLGSQVQHFCFPGNDANTVSHIHCIIPSPDGKYIFANDLGNDKIYRFTINDAANENNFLLQQTTAYTGEKGWGPRHITFSRDGKFAYLINELSDYCTVFSYKNGNLKPIQKVLANEEKGHGSADIHISPDGRFLYASHRLKNEGISIFRINKTTGHITKVGYQLTGKHPRNFSITPNGHFLLVACRDSNVIQVYKRNAITGMLENTHQDISLGKPVCIRFLP